MHENYQARLLIENDSKMNGKLIYEAMGRKSLHTVDFCDSMNERIVLNIFAAGTEWNSAG